MARMPEVKSFLVADTVLQEKGSNKWSVIGVFDQIVAPQFPTGRPGIGLYVKLADAEGRYKVRIEFRDSDDQLLTWIEGMEISTKGRVATVDFGMQIQNPLTIPKPGKYHFMIYLNGQLAQTVPVYALQATPGQPPAPPPAE